MKILSSNGLNEIYFDSTSSSEISRYTVSAWLEMKRFTMEASGKSERGATRGDIDIER